MVSLKNEQEKIPLKLLVDSAPVPFVVTNLEDGQFHYANRMFLELSGAPTLKKLTSMYAPSFYANPEDRLKLIDMVSTGTNQLEIEIQFKSFEGKVFWVSLSAKTLKYKSHNWLLCGLHDLRNYISAQNALICANHMLDDLYENAPWGFHSLDSEGTFLKINSTELKWLGYSEEEILGKMSFNEILTPHSLETFRKNFPEFKKSGFVRDLDFEIKRKDGTTFTAKIWATSVIDAQGNYLYSRSNMVDVTVERTQQKDLEAFRQNLTQLMVHDLRNPLTGVMNSLEFVQLRENLSPDGVKLLASGVKGVKKLINIINGLLDLGKIESNQWIMKKTSGDLQGFVKQICEDWQSGLGSKVLDYKDSGVPRVVGIDFDLMGRVLENLISNAVKYTGEDGKILVSLIYKPAEVMLSVTDNGLGMTAEEAEKAFDKYYQASIGRGSSGLGLYFCKIVIGLHEGNIEIQSEKGSGSTMVIRLPV